MQRFLMLFLLAATLLSAGCGGSVVVPAESTPTPTPTLKSYTQAPPMVIDTTKQYTATIETEKGNLVLELFAADTPVTVNNFVFLARDGFYDGSMFHRVKRGFVAQGGDRTGTGTLSPGYYIPNEITEHTHVAGALSMANAGPDKNGCQFFITFTDEHDLDGGYSVFGQLIEGMDVLEQLTPRDPFSSPPPDYDGDTIIRITIEES
jgi:peptidylprolyl isomerase